MKETPDLLLIRISVEEMRKKLQIQFAAHCDEMKDIFKKVIEQETEAFLKYGLAAEIKNATASLVKEELSRQVQSFIRDNRESVLAEIRSELKQKARSEMEGMIYDVLGDLKKRRKSDDDYE